MTIVRQYEDGTTITRSRGSFDDWCIYVNGRAPFDRDYFKQLLELAKKFGTDKVFKDFMELYNSTGQVVEGSIFQDLIPSISETYKDDSLKVEKLFGTLYMVMLAEQNRAYTKLGKRVKGLAVYQIFYEDYPIDVACNFSKGKNWRDLAQLCEDRNIPR